MMIPEKTIERLSLYRRLLGNLEGNARTHVFSHELATMSQSSAAQVRRDLMLTGLTGHPKRGYEVQGLIDEIDRVLDGPDEQRIAFVGVGNLGRALLSFFTGRRRKLAVVAAFDVDPYKVGRVIHGCRVHPVDQLGAVIREQRVRLGVITTPAEYAQDIADEMVAAGVTGIVNLAPRPLVVPDHVYVDQVDLTGSLERVAYFARHSIPEGDDIPES